MKKLLIILVLFFVLVSCLSCTKKQKNKLSKETGVSVKEIDEAIEKVSMTTISQATSYEIEFWTEYGGKKAVQTDGITSPYDIDKMYGLSYNISKVNKEYLDIVKSALDTANTTLQTYSKYKILYGTTGRISTITTYNKISDDGGKTFKEHTNGDCGRTTKNIRLATDFLNNYNEDGKKHIILHELGHAMGLIDLYDHIEVDSDFKVIEEKSVYFAQYSVMYYLFNTDSKYAFTDYTEFDKANIDYLFDK